MIRGIWIYVINIIFIVMISSCNRNPLDVDISDIELEFEIHRLDQELFTMDFDTVERAVAYFYRQYGDLFDVFNVHVINIGPASQRYYGQYLSMFVNNPRNAEVYEYTQDVYPDMNATTEQLGKAFRRYIYHFPDSLPPLVTAYISGFNHKLFTVGNEVGIGLDRYLGRDCPFYDLMGTPQYLQYNMHPGKIPSDVIQVWGNALFPYNDSIDNVLNRMVHGGLLLYFTDVLLPDMPDSLKIGFSPSQMQFVRSDEEQMWTYLVEHDLLFSTDPLNIAKLTDEAPSTSFFPEASPGQAAVWIGWQIVREYARRHPELSVSEIMKERDYQKILREARYSP